MKKKLLLIATLLIAAMLAFAACGRGDDEEPEIEGPPVVVQPTPPPQPAPLPPPAEVPAGTREYLLANMPADMTAVPGTYIINIAPIRPDANILGGWTNPMTNAHARILMSGLSTMGRNSENLFFPNPMVMVGGAWPTIRDNPDGSRTYTFEIYTDNQFSDGSFVTAANYAGGIALGTSPQWAALVPSAMDWLDLYGRDEWISGESDVLRGVRIYSESSFSLTIDAEHLPNVWEAAMNMGVGPSALHAFGVEAHDNGEGVFLTGPGGIPLTFEALHEAVNGGDAGYSIIDYDEDGNPVFQYDADGERVILGDGQRFRPTVFSGPYMFESVDVGNGTMTLVANPYFPGTWDGFRPRIERVMWRLVPLPLQIDAMAAGEVHISTGVTDGTALEQSISTLVEGGTHNFVNYDQFGQRLIQFHTDYGPTQFREVRQAIAFMIDRHAINEEVGRGFSVVAHGPWAPAWWWYQDAIPRGLYDRVHIYDLDMERAIQLLVDGGWNYNADGSEWVGPGDGVNLRHKWVDEWHWGTNEDGEIERWRDDGAGGQISNRVYTGERVLMPLIINWVATTQPLPGRDALEFQIFPNMEAAGGVFRQERNDGWGGIMQRGYQEAERFQFFYLGVGMGNPWVPWFLMSQEWIPSGNWGQVDCAVTRELSDRFRVIDITTPEGHNAFVDAFIDYMEHLTYELFSLPVRMALTHDFFPVWLGGWYATGLWAFPEAVQRAYIIQ